MDSGIHVLPTEMILKIFENLTLYQTVVNCSKTCIRWREIVALFVLRPKLLKLSKANHKFRMDAEYQGWTEECENVELILSLYIKYDHFASKY